MEDNFRRGQAGLLAKNLEDKMECPVCGSIDHPKLATVLDGVPTEEELKSCKDELDKLTTLREDKLTKLSDINGDIKGIKSELLKCRDKLALVYKDEFTNMDSKEGVEYIKLSIASFQKELKDLKQKRNRLDDILEDKERLEAELIKCNEGLYENEKTLRDFEKDYTDNYATLRSEEESLSSIEKEIPIEIRSYSKLIDRISELTREYNLLEKNYKKAQEDFSAAQNKYSSSNTDLELKHGGLQELKQETIELETMLEDRIKSAGFDDKNHYKALKMNEEKLNELENSIVEYYQKLRSLEDSLLRISEETKDLQQINIESITEDLRGLKKEKEELDIKEKRLYTRINNNYRAIDKIEKINEDIKEEEENYSIIADISRISNGDNEERITFERYVLAAYFDEIINASNTRLSDMTGGRYKLKRKDEKGKGRRQEGLELEVFDNYTGKARHVKTLSGGESFKASLSMALGLGDVVQSYAGGITIDTMFVDEGFGSLDPESLDKAIECLIDLQKSGRLVGIISHVPELKERIDVRLEVTPTKEGSKVNFIK